MSAITGSRMLIVGGKAVGRFGTLRYLRAIRARMASHAAARYGPCVIAVRPPWVAGAVEACLAEDHCRRRARDGRPRWARC